ncbi:hypothetical protein FJT64_019268 [Amphibalanus amphitrite]|uniref:Uncharacterized protein n=1 Tax=Amphibalanus amphitrite TaxID=1232801 RepID=A0A6A4X0M3_AMPAM|nr:hypothetical protein FJT64_019268 [Amphibalanus amphitrite]
MRELHHVPPRSPERPVYLPRQLRDASHVYIRRDGYKPPLVPPYDGPFAVVRRTAKTVTVLRNGREDVIAIDRVKPALVESSGGSPPADQSVPRPSPVTPSGHQGPELILRPAAQLPPGPRPATAPTPGAPRASECGQSRSDVCDRDPGPQSILRTRHGRLVRPPARYRDCARRVTFQGPT